MLDQLSSPTETRLTRLVDDIVRKNGQGRTPSRDLDLGDAGLSSVDMVNLMLAVEAEFDLSIPQGDITSENFRSIATMEKLVDRLIAGKPNV